MKPFTADDEILAITLFGSYNDQGPNPWKTFDGRDVPQWGALSEQVKNKWIAAAQKARELLIKDSNE